MPWPWAALWLELAALQLALRPSTAALVVVAGPRELLGLSLTSPPFAFTPETFRVRAPLALVNSADFDYAPGRPDTYRGNQNFSGKIALHVNVPWGSASAEQNARALGALGAVGWAMANEGDVGLFTPVTGYNTHRWIRGDTRSLATPVAVDITSREMLPLIAALRAGKELVAELSPSPFPGRAAYGSWWYWLLSAVVTLQLCIVLELALTKLHAFIRSDGGLHLSSIPQLLLLVEIWLCALRFVFCTVIHTTHSHTHIRARTHARMHARAALRARTHAHEIWRELGLETLPTRARAHARARTHAHTRTQKYTHTHTLEHTLAHLYIQTHTHTHIHTTAKNGKVALSNRPSFFFLP